MPSIQKSVSYALDGLKLALKEKHFKIHLLAATLVTIAGLCFHISQTEWLVCLVLFALVISLELVNSAIERLVDIVSPQQNPKAGAIKDMAAAAVLVASIVAVICAVLIFWKYIFVYQI